MARNRISKNELNENLQLEIEGSTEHLGQIATTEKLGHIKPDGETITVDPVTGVAKVSVDIGGGLSAKPYTGDLNSLVESGIYSCPANTPNAPNSLPLLVEVLASYDGNFVIQRATYDHLGTASIPAFTRRAIKDASGTLVWSTPNAGSVGFVGNWRVVDFILSDSLTDANTSAAATANAVKQVNDKVSANPINLTPNAPFVIEDTSGLTVGKAGNVAVLAFRVKPSQQLATTSQYQLCEILPVGYRNLRATVVGHGFCFVSSVARLIPVTVANGTVIMQAPPVAIPANTYIEGNITFYVG